MEVDWGRTIAQWELARGIPPSVERVHKELAIIYGLTCMAVKKRNGAFMEACENSIHQFLNRIDVVLCSGSDNSLNNSALSRLHCLCVKQLPQVKELLSLTMLWRLIVVFIILALSTGYENDTLAMVDLLNESSASTEPCVRKTALIVCCMLHPDHCESSMTDSNMSETVLYNRGCKLFSNSEWDVAIATVQTCVHSSDILVVSAVNVLIGCCHAKQGRLQMALCYMQKAMKCDIRIIVYALHNLIQVFKASSNNDGEMEASKLLYQALYNKEDTTDSVKYQWSAYWLMDRTSTRSSLQVSSLAIPSPDILNDLVVQAYHYACRAHYLRRFDVAVEMLHTLVDNTTLPIDSDYLPSPSQLVVELCHSLVCAGLYHDAIQRCDKLIQLLTQYTLHCKDSKLHNITNDDILRVIMHAKLLLYKGEALWHLGKPHEAVIQYRRGLQTLTVIERCNSYGKQCDQLATQFFNNLSLVLIGLGKDAEALPLLIEAIERDPATIRIINKNI
ncbi:uncharacterized protein [Dysidea avara]|uniref:uncharacterized protein isoform X2 n=1 Tax=Dysidea avara TaxID=196820 RepID=UPI00332B5276